MPKMTTDEITRYLDAPGRLVRVGTVGGDGTPLVVPTWFVVEDGRFLVTPRERSSWFANLQRSPQVCFTVDGDGSQVIVRGEVQVVHGLGEDDSWRDVYRRITLRYLPESAADAYLQDTWDEPRALLSLVLSDARVTTWRFPLGPGEDWLDVWAPRYYHDGHPRAQVTRERSGGKDS
ncbi:MAG TPA: pyridoxamine 5'-phosphate oxidase family protein [Acidimicrobiales bacterium]|nr:pyridoxamine 5'-phosphate oxidase family protein [Acidimicrobiales bacterium]